MGGQRGQGKMGNFQASREAVGGVVGVKLAVYSTRADPTEEGSPWCVHVRYVVSCFGR